VLTEIAEVEGMTRSAVECNAIALTRKYGMPVGPSADWISSAWSVGGAGGREVFIVDQEQEDEHGRPLYAIVGRRWDDEREEYDDHVYLIDDYVVVAREVAPCAICGEFLAGNTCCPPHERWDLPGETPGPEGLSPERLEEARIILARARTDLGDLEGAELDLLADNMMGSLDELRAILVALGERPEAQPTGIEVLGAYGELPTTVLDEQFGNSRPLPWNPAANGWFLGGSRWIQYRRQQDDGTPIYAVVDWDGVEVGTLFTGRVDEVIPWLMRNLVGEIGAPRTVGHGYRVTPEMARGVRRISSNDPAGQTYIVDGEEDEDGYTQWVNDAVGFLHEKNARSDMTHFPYRDQDERIPYRAAQELLRLHGPWRIEERAAVFKHRRADVGFMLKFRFFSAGEADEGQRVQLFLWGVGEGNIRDIVIITWLAAFDSETDTAIVGFRLVNGDNGIEIMNGQIDVPATGWNRGHSTVRKILDLAGVRAVFIDNNWPEEYYLNIGYADNPFVYF